MNDNKNNLISVSDRINAGDFTMSLDMYNSFSKTTEGRSDRRVAEKI